MTVDADPQQGAHVPSSGPLPSALTFDAISPGQWTAALQVTLDDGGDVTSPPYAFVAP